VPAETRHADAPFPRLGYVPALDGIRGIAILAVTGLHFSGISGGFFGVDLFFVLSGFLITTLLLEEHDRVRGISLRGFYLRRARRLFPAVGALLVAFVLVGTVAIGARRAVELAAYGGLYFANFIRAFAHPDPLGGPLGPLWSLAQEEQFYLVWPPLLILLLRKRLTSRRIIRALVLVFVALVGYRAALAASGASWHRIYYAPDTHADGLVLGCLLAYLRRSGLCVRGVISIAAAFMFVVAVLFGGETIAWSVYGLPMVEVASAVLVLSALESGVVERALSFSPLVWIGSISYSLYVWGQFGRWLAPGRGNVFLALALTVILTLVSYYLIERPFRARSRRSIGPTPAPAPST
jgi:peptidoglycan/LPS O-acetylase OafA/YrhL